MQQVVVERFGGTEELQLREVPTPTPRAGQVLVRLMSIGMNHADLMGRRGDYKLSTGDPPYTPGLEGGGVIEAVGEGVDTSRVGERVVLAPQVTRPQRGLGGTYRSHYVCGADEPFVAPAGIPDDWLGALWLSHLTSWGCLMWKHNRQGVLINGPRDQVVGLPAASSSVALAAAQVVRTAGGTSIGLTTSEAKVADIREVYDHVVVTHDADGQMKPWHRDLKRLTEGRGVDIFFDPVAAGDYLNTEIRCLAQRGVIYVYGLLGKTGPVDVTPLIRKHARIEGYVNDELFAAGDAETMQGCSAVLDLFSAGRYTQRIGQVFPLADVREAHEAMQRGTHVGKMVLVP